MTTHNEGHFSTKHAPGTQVSAGLQKAVQEKLASGTITCHEAHSIADELKVSPADVGVAIDLAEGRILKCQLGLFGFGKGIKMVKEAKSIMPALRDAIDSAMVNDHLSCAAAWQIANAQAIPRIAVANACEMLAVKIKPCQLGAF